MQEECGHQEQGSTSGFVTEAAGGSASVSSSVQEIIRAAV